MVYSGQMAVIKDPGEDWPLPSSNDKEKIRRIILRFERKNPGAILHTIEEVRAEHQAGGLHTRKAEYGEVNKAAQGRTLFELPEELGHEIVKVAPFVFRSRKHLHWFIKNFPELLIHKANQISRL